jgi:hypothetical protein
VPPLKNGNSSHLTEGRKEVINTTTRTQQEVTYPAYPSLRNTAGAPGGKKKTQNTNYRGIRNKSHNQNNSRCVNLNAECNSKTTTLHQKPIPPLRMQTSA